jgi:hypothetical protein
MQTTQEVSEEILWRYSLRGLGNWVQDKREEKVKAVCDEELSVIAEDNMIIRDPPRRRVVFERSVEERTEHGKHDLLVRTGGEVRKGSDAGYRKNIRGQVHCLAAHHEKQSEDFFPVVLELFG